MKFSTFECIPKEAIMGLRFPAEEVIDSPLEQKERMSKLFLATKLGNIEHGKIKIFFHDESGVKMVETTIWATSDKNIVLKQGMVIPIHRILEVNFH